MLRIIPEDKVVYVFSPNNKSVEYAEKGDILIFEAVDALGGQIKSEKDTIDDIDWSHVDGITGPVYVKNSSPGDTLVLKILDIEIGDKGFMVVVPKYGALGHLDFKPKVKVVNIKENFAFFDDIKIRINPMIGTIGVAPSEGEIETASLGKHGGNMDCKEVTAGTTIYLPVFTEGALLGVGDLHALQADGELSVSSIEIGGKVKVEIVDILKGKKIPWPILNNGKEVEILACADTLDEAAKEATYIAVKALMRRYNLTFEEAYMLGSLVIDLRINQVVDPKKGIRAAIPLEYLSPEDLLE